VRCCALAFLGLASAPTLAQAQLPPAPTHEVEPSEEARKYFQTGVELLQDPDGARYEEAFKAFRRAYEISPSWKILGNLGLTALKLERSTEAIAAYERYLSEGGTQIDPSERAQIKRDLEVTRTSSGTVALHVSGGAAALITDTRERSVGGPVVNSYQLAEGEILALQLIAGHHVIAASTAGKHASVDLDVQAGTKQDQELSFDQAGPAVAAPVPGAPAPVPPAPTPTASTTAGSSGLRTAGLVVGGVGVAALVGGAVAGLVGLKKRSNLTAECPDHTCSFSSADEQSKFQSDRDSLKTMGTVTSVLLLGGGALTAVGVTLFVVGGNKHQEQVSLVTEFSPFGGTLAARGAF
jgi:Tetratricopeptide repeat